MNILINTFLNFAQAYGAGAYNTDTYGGGSATGGASASGAGGLVGTGFAVAAVITVACLIIFVALLVRFSRRKKTA